MHRASGAALAELVGRKQEVADEFVEDCLGIIYGESRWQEPFDR